jgi:deoxycytidine triphosphate deaminase
VSLKEKAGRILQAFRARLAGGSAYAATPKLVPGDAPSIAVLDNDDEQRSRRETQAILDEAKRRLSEVQGDITDELTEARRRFLQHRRKDPFPCVPAALLNCGQVFDYVAKTGMIVPFDLNPELFKIASYDFALLGTVVYWDEEGVERRDEITEGKRFVLKANSIAFVTLRPFLQLPDYIALRFNLRIRNVYRGLLLGTGPLVDPGFQGRLSIPLHNLTTNNYTFVGGEALITVEFTKVAGDWANSQVGGESRLHFPFKEPTDLEFSDRTVDHFLNKGGPLREVRSSIPKVTADAAKAAAEASRKADLTVLFTAVTTVLAVAGVVSAVWDSTLFTKEVRAAQHDEIEALRHTLDELNDSLRVARARADSALDLTRGGGSPP